MEKAKYKEFADQVKAVIELFEQSVSEANETVSKIMLDWQFSPAGKERNKKIVFDDLQAKTDNMNKLFKEVVKRYCDEYRVKMPEDNKNHAEDMANALKVLEMLGYGLTVPVLLDILEPLKGSYKCMKKIENIIMAKNQKSIEGMGYSYEVLKALQEEMKTDIRIEGFFDKFAELEAVIDSKGFSFSATTYGNSTVLQLIPDIPYLYYATADWMMQLAEMYSEFENEFPDLFTKHIPTNEEVILDSLK